MATFGTWVSVVCLCLVWGGLPPARAAGVRHAWFVPLTSSGMLQRFHVTVQAIHDTQNSDNGWVLAVVADEAVRDAQARNAIYRVADKVITIQHGLTKPLVDYFEAGYGTTQRHLIDTSTDPGESMLAVWADTDLVMLQPLHTTLTTPIGPTQMALVPTDTSTLYLHGKHFAVLGHDVALVRVEDSLYRTLEATALPHVLLNASYAAKASDLHNYRSTWLALQGKGCVQPKSTDATVLCGVTSIFYEMRTFSPWNWWTYPLIRLNIPWTLTASHVEGRNIPWYVWILKLSHFLAMFVVVMLSHALTHKVKVNEKLDSYFPEKMRVGPRPGHVAWLVRTVFFVTYVAVTLFYPEEIWPWYGWLVAILWLLVLCYTLLDVIYYPWMRHQGRHAPIVLEANLGLFARRHLEEGEAIMPLELVRDRAKNTYILWHVILFLGIVGGIIVVGYVIGEGRMALVYLAAFTVRALSWFSGFVSSSVQATAMAAYEKGWVERKWEEEDPTKES